MYVKAAKDEFHRSCKAWKETVSQAGQYPWPEVMSCARVAISCLWLPWQGCNELRWRTSPEAVNFVEVMEHMVLDSGLAQQVSNIQRHCKLAYEEQVNAWKANMFSCTQGLPQSGLSIMDGLQ